MSLTITNKEFSVFGTKRVVFCDIAFDNSYPTGGEALTPNTLGLSEAKFVSIAGSNGYLFEYDYTNSKIKALYPTSVTSAIGTVNHSLGFATGADAFITATAAHHGVEVGSEVADETDLSGITSVKVMMIGR